MIYPIVGVQFCSCGETEKVLNCIVPGIVICDECLQNGECGGVKAVNKQIFNFLIFFENKHVLITQLDKRILLAAVFWH